MKPNQSLQPTTMSVTDRAFARSAPAKVVADLYRWRKDQDFQTELTK